MTSAFTESSINKPVLRGLLARCTWHAYSEHPVCVVFLLLLLLAIIFIPIGILIIRESDAFFEICVRYDDTNNYRYRVGPSGLYPYSFAFNNSIYSTGAMVKKMFSLSKSLASPIYLQYRLVGFYQNYRRYVASRDNAQRNGDTSSAAPKCEPFRHPGEFQGKIIDGKYFPCGTIAWSLFNDSFRLYGLSANQKNSGNVGVLQNSQLICKGDAFDELGNSLEKNNLCVKKGIALPSDVRIFKPLNKSNVDSSLWTFYGDSGSSDPYKKEGYYYGEAGHKIPFISDEDHIIWASLAYTSDFTKKYRIITTNLIAGDYLFEIVENFDVFSFSGQKYACLVSPSRIGGRKYLWGILFLCIGSISFVLSLSVIIRQYKTLGNF